MKRKVLITGATETPAEPPLKSRLPLDLMFVRRRFMTVGEFARAHLDKLNPKKNGPSLFGVGNC